MEFDDEGNDAVAIEKSKVRICCTFFFVLGSS